MGIYDYLNTNNNQTADLSYNANAKALIDSLMAGTNITHSYLPPLIIITKWVIV